mgnify:CR=1 FL=1
MVIWENEGNSFGILDIRIFGGQIFTLTTDKILVTKMETFSFSEKIKRKEAQIEYAITYLNKQCYKVYSHILQINAISFSQYLITIFF